LILTSVTSTDHDDQAHDNDSSDSSVNPDASALQNSNSDSESNDSLIGQLSNYNLRPRVQKQSTRPLRVASRVILITVLFLIISVTRDLSCHKFIVISSVPTFPQSEY